MIELIKQKLGKGTTIGAKLSGPVLNVPCPTQPSTEDPGAMDSFLLVEDIMRYRHNIKILMLDDLSDDEIPERIVELLLTHYENLPDPEGMILV